jgi:phosphoserine phosphatase
MTAELLPSWRPGATRDALVSFLDAAAQVPVERRVAVLDNDGTLWCERPRYPQLDFFLAALADRVRAEPTTADRLEYAALLGGDSTAIDDVGLERIALALSELFAGLGPEEFAERARRFVFDTRHPELDRVYAGSVYQPMLELLDELRRRHFDVFVVTGGGTEFVRAVSHDLYGVEPHGVVGTLVQYQVERHEGRLRLVRTARIAGAANEGEAKVAHIQQHLGRRPILAVGNSGGDREMLEWACSGDGPGLALLIDHDDDEREYAYLSRAVTFDEATPITDVARELGWTVVSMARDWATVFPQDPIEAAG